MNFIKDKGASAFLTSIDKYLNIWKIILLDNQTTEEFKKRAKYYDLIEI